MQNDDSFYLTILRGKVYGQYDYVRFASLWTHPPIPLDFRTPACVYFGSRMDGPPSEGFRVRCSPMHLVVAPSNLVACGQRALSDDVGRRRPSWGRRGR